MALFFISKGIFWACVVNTNTTSPQKQAGNLLLYRSRVLTSYCKCWAGLKMYKKSSEIVQRISIFYSICHPRISKCFLSYPSASWTIPSCDRQMLSCPLYKWLNTDTMRPLEKICRNWDFFPTNVAAKPYHKYVTKEPYTLFFKAGSNCINSQLQTEPREHIHPQCWSRIPSSPKEAEQIPPPHLSDRQAVSFDIHEKEKGHGIVISEADRKLRSWKTR